MYTWVPAVVILNEKGHVTLYIEEDGTPYVYLKEFGCKHLQRKLTEKQYYKIKLILHKYQVRRKLAK